MKGILKKLTNIRSRHVADIVIGILAAVSSVWIDVTWFHRVIIGITVAFAMETFFRWNDERLETKEDDEEDIISIEEMKYRVQRNRDNLFGQKRMP